MNSISIIIATYNAEKVLQSCLDSIIMQHNDNIEIIIIDGKSTDQTIDIIKNNQYYISQWVSEPDNGIYDAWNKGITLAKNKWIMFLGADDKLTPNALSLYMDFLTHKENVDCLDLITSKVQMTDHLGNLKRIKGTRYQWPLYLKDMAIAHPGALHSKKLFAQYGKFDTTYKIVGDYEFLLRAGGSLNTFFIDAITVHMMEGGVSDSASAIKEHYRAVTSANYNKTLAQINFIIAYIKFIIRKGLNL